MPTPRLSWSRCRGKAQCASVRLPLNYDRPAGPTTEVGLLRLPARSPQRRIGSLFINPGGPGVSAVEFVRNARSQLSPRLLRRFDVVGFDPRGVGASENLQCFSSPREQYPFARAIASSPFPDAKKQEQRFIKAYRTLHRACGTAGRRLAGAMSTAQVARDMDVLRRAVGDERLTYYGLSYGSYLGQVYANMFPDRVRAVGIDGVIDPRAWAGSRFTGSPIGDRIRSADGAWAALQEMLQRCGSAGEALCPFASADPVGDFARIAEQLRISKVRLEVLPGQKVRYGYTDLVQDTLLGMYQSDGSESIAKMLSDLRVLTTAPRSTRAADRGAARRVAHVSERLRSGAPSYLNLLDVTAAVTCTDGRRPARLSQSPGFADDADARAPYFGRSWAWNWTCSDSSWNVEDEDAYRGPFDRRTSAPVLIVGNYWDPATNYDSAVRVSELLPNSRLLRSDSWGHTALGSSRCVDRAVDDYLVRVRLPRRQTVCQGDVQPFASASAARRELTVARGWSGR